MTMFWSVAQDEAKDRHSGQSFSKAHWPKRSCCSLGTDMICYESGLASLKQTWPRTSIVSSWLTDPIVDEPPNMKSVCLCPGHVTDSTFHLRTWKQQLAAKYGLKREENNREERSRCLHFFCVHPVDLWSKEEEEALVLWFGFLPFKKYMFPFLFDPTPLAASFNEMGRPPQLSRE